MSLLKAGLPSSNRSHFISFNTGNVKLSWSERWTQRTHTKILINPVLQQEHRTLLHWWEMDGMSDLQMASVSSESSGQSGSPSQSQASETQVFRSRQWNSPMSHKMVSKMAWGKEWGKERGKCSIRWWLADRRITWLAGCTFEHGCRCC